MSRPRVVVFANEKGGTGKTTLAFHAAVGLAHGGREVAALDLDVGQRSLTRYLENRRPAAQAGRLGRAKLTGIDLGSEIAAQPPETQARRLAGALSELSGGDVIVIDTPGARTALTRAALGHADLLVTPVNDSLVDVGALAELDTLARRVKGPSAYTQLIWEENSNRVLENRAPLRWTVVKNRVPHVHSRNQEAVDYLLRELSWRLRFELGPVLRERVIYRELFLNGLTLMDLRAQNIEPGTASHVAASEEIGRLVAMIETALEESAPPRS